MPVIMLNRYMATFAPGFESVIGGILSETAPAARIEATQSGMILFSLAGNPAAAVNAPVFNNVFLVVRDWKKHDMTFPAMVNTIVRSDSLARIAAFVRSFRHKSFRVRFSKENQFVSVDKKLVESAERHIASVTGMLPDRVNPACEFWFIIRREAFSCFSFRLTKKQSTEKYLRQGELRPELVQLIVALSAPGPEDSVFADPFAGYGSIPSRILANRKGQACTVYVSDSDPRRVADLQSRFSGSPGVVVRKADARDLSFIADASVHRIITDPPWGEWEQSSPGSGGLARLYEGMLDSFARILAPGGRVCVLSSAKREMEEAVAKNPVFGTCAVTPGFRTDILVNGKKSAVFALYKAQEYTNETH